MKKILLRSCLIAALVLLTMFAFSAMAVCELNVGYNDVVIGSNETTFFTYTADGDCYCYFSWWFDTAGSDELIISTTKNMTEIENLSSVKMKRWDEVAIKIENPTAYAQSGTIYIYRFDGLLDEITEVYVDGTRVERTGTIYAESDSPITLSFNPVEGAEYYELSVTAGIDSESFILPGNIDQTITSHLGAGSSVTFRLRPRGEGMASSSFDFYGEFSGTPVVPGENELKRGDNPLTVGAGKTVEYTFRIPFDGYYRFESFDFSGKKYTVTRTGPGELTKEGEDPDRGGYYWESEGRYEKDDVVTFKVRNRDSSELKVYLTIECYEGVLSVPQYAYVNGNTLEHDERIDVDPYEPVRLSFAPVENAGYYKLTLYVVGEGGYETYIISDVGEREYDWSAYADKAIRVKLYPKANYWKDDDDPLIICIGLTGADPYGGGDTALTLPNDLTAVKDGAFMNIAAEKVILPRGVESIGKRAFADSNVRKITLPVKDCDIADDAFEGCTDVTLYGKSGGNVESYAASKGFTFKPVA